MARIHQVAQSLRDFSFLFTQRLSAPTERLKGKWNEIEVLMGR